MKDRLRRFLEGEEIRDILTEGEYWEIGNRVMTPDGIGTIGSTDEGDEGEELFYVHLDSMKDEDDSEIYRAEDLRPVNEAEEIWWEVGMDMGEEAGTQTVDQAETKEEAMGLAQKYLHDDTYKNYGIFIDEWTMVDGTPQPTGKAEVLRKVGKDMGEQREEGEVYWEVEIDKGEEEGTEPVDGADTKEEALKVAQYYLDSDLYADYGVFIDEVRIEDETPMPTGNSVILRKFPGPGKGSF